MKILKELRKQRDLTLRQVEEATGISNAYLSQLENGKIRHPSAQVLYALSKLYGCNIEDLLIAAGMIKNDERVIPIKPKQTLEQRIELLETEVARLKSLHTLY